MYSKESGTGPDGSAGPLTLSLSADMIMKK
jgi:hypothetical protein